MVNVIIDSIYTIYDVMMCAQSRTRYTLMTWKC